MTESTSIAMPATPPRKFQLLFWVVVLAVALLGFAGSRLVGRLFDNTMKRGRPPVIATIEQDVSAMTSDGRSVQLSSLRGKVCVIGYIYTICPHGCAAVVAEMKHLLGAHGDREDFQLVSVSVVPERDTVEMLRGFAAALGVKTGEPWWFLNGNRVQLDQFMSEELRLNRSTPIPEDERMNPLDLYEHDLRLTLVDRQGRVRGHYSVAHPQAEIAGMAKIKLRSDTDNLLKDPRL